MQKLEIGETTLVTVREDAETNLLTRGEMADGMTAEIAALVGEQ